MDYINYPFIPFKPSEKSVLRRLGYHKNTEIDEARMLEIKRMMAEAADLYIPKARAVRMPIVQRDENSFMLKNGLKITSEKLLKMLEFSDAILLMGATLGDAVIEKINDELKNGDAVFAVVLDAYASECVDDALNYIMKAQGLSHTRTGEKTTKHRFSAGYGDLDIAYQKEFFDILSLCDLGVKINKSFMLSPEKSVIAIAGLEK